jgi:hypothetical protein
MFEEILVAAESFCTRGQLKLRTFMLEFYTYSETIDPGPNENPKEEVPYENHTMGTTLANGKA